MTPDTLADREAIKKNLWDYANAVDLRRFDLFEGLFVPEARLTYGGRSMNLRQAKVWLSEKLTSPPIRAYYHMMGNMRIALAADSAESLTRCFNPMEFLQPDGTLRLWFNAMWYHWRHVRTAEGWRLLAGGPHSEGATLGGLPPSSIGWTTPAYAPGPIPPFPARR